MKKLALLMFVILNAFAFSQNKIPDLPNQNNHPFYKAMVGKHFPIEDFKDENGKNFPVDYMKGKITMVNLWSVTCEPCIEEMPFLNQLKEKLEDKINFVGITNNDKEKVDKFLLKHTFNFTQITGADYKMFNKNNFTRFPFNFLLDENGNIFYLLGNFNQENADQFIKAFLN